MRILFLIVALCIPNLSSAANYLCLPTITIGWMNSSNPNDLGKIPAQHKWLLQQIEPQSMPVTWVNEEVAVNYSVKRFGEEKPFGFCDISNDVWNQCYEFHYPGEQENPEIDNKLKNYNAFRFSKDDEGSWAYVWIDKGKQIFYGINGVPQLMEPKIAIERGNCEAF